MKKPQLIAAGFIILGLLLFGSGIFLITKEYFSRQPADANYTFVYQPSNTPAVTSSTNKRAATPKPTKEPTMTPIPVIPSTVKQIAYNRWLVSLHSKNWFETSIPVIANDTINITTPGKEKVENVQFKINNKSHFTTDGQQLYMFEEYGIDAGFKDTLKLRLMEGTESQDILLIIDPNVGRCLARDDENHMALHASAMAWAILCHTSNPIMQ